MRSLSSAERMTSDAGFVGVVVLGMHRSGTSAIAGLFADVGYFVGLPEDVLGVNETQPGGHNENQRVIDLNDSLFESVGREWVDPPRDDELAGLLSRSDRVTRLIDDLLAEGGGAPLVLKDPRINALLPVWHAAIADRLMPVLTVRDPVEVAMSLSRRLEGALPLIPIPQALAIWEIYTVRTLQYLVGKQVLVAPYAQLFESVDVAHDLVGAASAALMPEMRDRLDLSHAGSRITDALYRNHARPTDHPVTLTLRQARLWDHLASLASGPQTLKVPVELLELPSPSQVTAEGVRELRNAARDRMREWELLVLERDKLTRKLHERNKLTTKLTMDIDRLTAQVTEFREEADTLRESLQAQAESLGAQLDASSAELRRLANVVETMKSSRSWRLTKPLREAKRLVLPRRRRSKIV